MGEAFKVLAITGPEAAVPAGVAATAELGEAT
jgi:hypothetical protein